MTRSLKAAAFLALALVAFSPVAHAQAPVAAGTKVETSASTTETKSVYNGVVKHHVKKAGHKKTTAIRKAMPKAAVKTEAGAKAE